MKKKTKTLALHKETLRILSDDAELRAVAGGKGRVTAFAVCPTQYPYSCGSWCPRCR